MTVRHRQEFSCAIAQPLVTRAAVALGAMAIAARPVSHLVLAAMVALLHLSTKRSGTASADVSEGLPLLGRKHVSPTIKELLSVLSENIGDFRLR